LVPRFDCFEAVESSPFLFENSLGGLGPYEGLRVGIVAVEIVMDGVLEIAHARECAAANALLGDLRKEALDEIEPVFGVKCRWKPRWISRCLCKHRSMRLRKRMNSLARCRG
jgi:hypothetical protein